MLTPLDTQLSIIDVNKILLTFAIFWQPGSVLKSWLIVLEKVGRTSSLKYTCKILCSCFDGVYGRWMGWMSIAFSGQMHQYWPICGNMWTALMPIILGILTINVQLWLDFIFVSASIATHRLFTLFCGSIVVFIVSSVMLDFL